MCSAGNDAMKVSGCRRRVEPGLPLPPEGMDLGLDMIESQCAATCDPSKPPRPCFSLTLPNKA